MQSVPYSSLSSDISRLSSLLAAFESRFGKDGDLFAVSAPGRIEVLGNHTDHNGGKAVAAAVTQDILCVCRKREDKKVSLFSESSAAEAGTAPYDRIR